MKYLHLVWASLFRRKTRTFLTLVSIIAAFLLFGLLDAVRTSFAQAGQSANGAARLQTGSKLSFIQPLPMLAAARRSRRSPGVKDVTYANWFGGAYQDPHNQVFSFAVAPNYLDIYPESRSATPSARPSPRHAPARSSARRWPSASTGRWATRCRCSRRSFPTSTGSKNWQFDIVGILHATDKKTGRLLRPDVPAELEVLRRHHAVQPAARWAGT